jgi:hypothetical protein
MGNHIALGYAQGKRADSCAWKTQAWLFRLVAAALLQRKRRRLKRFPCERDAMTSFLLRRGGFPSA